MKLPRIDFEVSFPWPMLKDAVRDGALGVIHVQIIEDFNPIIEHHTIIGNVGRRVDQYEKQFEY